MKKPAITGLFLLLTAFALSAQSLPSIRIVNNTGEPINYIVVSPSNNDQWGDNVLGDTILENGQTFTYQLPFSLNSVSLYDIGLQDIYGDTYVKWEFRVTNNARIVFTEDDLEDWDG